MEGDALTVLRTLPDCSVQMCVTSPPYFGLRDYGVVGQMGLERAPQDYVANMGDVFAEVHRVLRNDGTLWLNIGDSYAGGAGGRGDAGNLIEGKPTSVKHNGERIKRILGDLKSKDLIGIPWMLAFMLRSRGWYLRSDIIWHKPNPMPESVTDRPTKSHEYLFLLSKSPTYYYDADAIAEQSVDPVGVGRGGSLARIGADRFVAQNAHRGPPPISSGQRNRRSVWSISTMPYSEAHFATFPPKLIEPCILAGSAKGDTVLDPFMGAGTTGLVADRLGRNAIGIELNPKYAEMARKRITDDSPLFGDVA